MIIGCLRETSPGEHRVGLVPEAVRRLRDSGAEVVIEIGAGTGAWFPDEAYVEAGATVTTRERVFQEADLVVAVDLPADIDDCRFRPGQAILGLFRFAGHPELLQRMTDAKITVLSFTGLPRTLSRAQSMDALTSQANIAGYKAALVAADNYPGYFPMLMTAAGTIRPATVLVVGAGVAGLQAIATARRLGATVTGYDVRETARADIRSTGAQVLELPDVAASGTGGYARQLTDQERTAQQGALETAVPDFDVVITTAQVPDGPPPLLLPSGALGRMRSGSVVVDLAGGEFGGNVAGSRPGRTVITPNGVRVIGAGNLPAAVPAAASAAYARNVGSLLGHLISGDGLVLDPSDEITDGVLLSHEGVARQL